ncbi:MAG: Tm-1-like ATP-binding domain-containing protein [Desulfobacterales bacterium]|nr:Tm-1-like ATP-binding domain-containing protein [Desulfobacterales bacterium]MDX2511146.1 Tm-1-like ATP-binding domain-containing protein [Desulfobacterales bacterium]
MTKSILVISTLDTKGVETLYLKEKIESLGFTAMLMDLSMRASAEHTAEITNAQVAEAGGSSIQEIGQSRERSRITKIMTSGASRLAKHYHDENRIDGVIAMGGSTGTLMASDVMRALPFGVPKVVISSTAALPGLSTRYIGTGDIVLFHSVIEISGLSNLLKNVMDRAAHAITGMVHEIITPMTAGEGKAIALTMLGPCEACASSVRQALEQSGYQVIGFSAAGIGDRAMEQMIAEGFFHGVIDLAPGGVGEHLFGFMRDAGPFRLENAGRLGIPMIVSTCSVNHMTPSKSKYQTEYHWRRKYDLDKFRTWIRLSPEELQKVARAFALKLNKASGPVKVLIPADGWSSVDQSGNPTYDPQEDQIFVEVLRKNLNPEIEIAEVNANMEDKTFAQAVVETALDIF